MSPWFQLRLKASAEPDRRSHTRIRYWLPDQIHSRRQSNQFGSALMLLGGGFTSKNALPNIWTSAANVVCGKSYFFIIENTFLPTSNSQTKQRTFSGGEFGSFKSSARQFHPSIKAATTEKGISSSAQSCAFVMQLHKSYLGHLHRKPIINNKWPGLVSEAADLMHITVVVARKLSYKSLVLLLVAHIPPAESYLPVPEPVLVPLFSPFGFCVAFLTVQSSPIS